MAYSEKTRAALVAADQEIAREGLSPHHTSISGTPAGLTLAGIGLSNAIHRGWIDTSEHDSAVQIEIARRAGIKIESR